MPVTIRFRIGAAQARAAGLAGDVLLGIHHAVQRIVDRVIAGAATEIALEHARQVVERILIEGRRGHDHAGGAVAALEGLRIEKGLLHGMKLAVPSEPLDGGDLALLGAKGRHQAAVERHAVEPDGAGAAVALVAALLDAEPAVVAQEGAQALAWCRLGGKHLAVDRELHRAASSSRICTA